MVDTMMKDNPIDVAMNVLDSKISRQFATNMHACVHCGQCSDVCQFFLATGDPKMSPVYKTEVLRKMYKRKHDWMGRLFPGWVHAKEPSEELLKELYDVAWGSCTMCRRCTMTCPMGVDTALLIRTARTMLEASGQIPQGLKDTVDIHLSTGNNMGVPREEFIATVEWMEEELQDDLNDPSIKFPIDKAGAKYILTLNPREVKFYPLLLQAQGKILNAAGEDWTLSSNVWDATNYALFSGNDKDAKEICGRFVDEVERMGVQGVVMTECGHGYRAMRFEAENWLGRQLPFEIMSFNELMAQYIKEGRIIVDPSVNTQPVTYHDPCNQARSGGLIDEPRYILKRSVMDFRELTPHGTNNICCGGGGGALTMSEFRNRRIEVARIKADQIKATGATIVATSCHNCIDQLFEVNRSYDLGVQVKNLCELVADALIWPRQTPKEKSGTTAEIDAQGYLKDPSRWDRSVAQFLASEHRMSNLTEEHWQVIDYVRNWNNTYKSWPVPKLIYGNINIDPRRIFSGPPEVIFKVSGLANPGNRVPWDERDLLDRMETPEHSNSYSVLHEISSVNSGGTLQTALRSIVENVASDLGARGCSLMLFTPDKDHLRHVASYGLSRKYITKGRISVDKSVHQALRGKPTAILNAAEDERVQYREQAKEEGIVSILTVPVTRKGDVLGVLRVYTGEPCHFTNDNIYFVSTAAKIGAISLANAVQKDSDEMDFDAFRKQLKQVLEEEWAHRTRKSDKAAAKVPVAPSDGTS